jgi:isopenicillin N synthase-like dioxygenase
MLAESLARLIALALNLEESFFDQPGLLDKTVSMMRLIHYSGQSLALHNHCDVLN